jgi:hypothetical protein
MCVQPIASDQTIRACLPLLIPLQALERAPPTPDLLQQLHQRTAALRNASLEEPRLRLVVEGFSAADWEDIAADLAAGRSGAELQRHWACQLSEAALREWSAEELLRLG